MGARPYDAIIVGARVAGAGTALQLARRGCRVLLIDRARFPSDIPHGHMIHKDGPGRLRRWGLLDRLVEAGTPPVDAVTTYFGDFPLTARGVEVDGVAWGYAPRRRLLDEMLVREAVAAGAELREGFSVEELLFDGERVTGVRGRSSDAILEERASITIGADGRNSRVAHAVKAACDADLPTLICYYFSYWSGVPSEGMEIYHVDGQVCFAHPTNDGLFAVFVGWPAARFHEVRADIEHHFMVAVDRFPDLGERLRAGTREERFYGTADLRNIRRKPAGDGWALVGDAGCHKDPYMALGIADALRDADLLAGAVDDGLSGRTPMAAALGSFEQQRNQASIPEFNENLVMARLAPAPPDLLALRAALSGDAEQTRHFWMARVGLVPRESFFNPDHLARIRARADATPS